MTRKLKLVPILLFMLLSATFATVPGGYDGPAMPVDDTERCFWGTSSNYGPCTNGRMMRTRKTYRFWICVDSDTSEEACAG